MIRHPDICINNYFSYTGREIRELKAWIACERVQGGLCSPCRLCVWQISLVVCKHVCKLGEVLTAATPRLEQRFDADLKED